LIGIVSIAGWYTNSHHIMCGIPEGPMNWGRRGTADNPNFGARHVNLIHWIQFRLACGVTASEAECFSAV
jgi:hypothetical protein